MLSDRGPIKKKEKEESADIPTTICLAKIVVLSVYAVDASSRYKYLIYDK